MSLRDRLPLADDAARGAAHLLRRGRGIVQARGAEVTGTAPNQVIEAIKTSLAGRHTAAERAWFDRIEKQRAALLTSERPLELIDYGAGKSAELGEDDAAEVRTLTRTLGHMTLSSKPAPWARLLFSIIRHTRPAIGVELGACVGISASYEAAAMQLNDRGHLYTLEGAPPLAERSAHTLAEIGLEQRASVVEGTFADQLDRLLGTTRPVEFAFIDGHHLEAPTMQYMEQFLAAAGPEAVLVFDDVNWSPGMRRAWDRVCADERFALTVGMRAIGLAVVSASATSRHGLTISYR